MRRFALLPPILALSILLAPSPARAHHVVWLDFSQFNLSAFTLAVSNPLWRNPAQSLVERLVVQAMTRDLAPYDVHVSTAKPVGGRYTRVVFLPGSATTSTGGVLLGTAGTPAGTGIGSWDKAGIGLPGLVESRAVVYAGSYAGLSQFQGAAATTPRIATALAGTASHELGHVIGLTHCHAADDFSSSGATCTDGYGATADANVNWHIMASGASTGLLLNVSATRDRFYSIHSSRRVLYSALQARNHWKVLQNVGKGAGGPADLVYGRPLAFNKVRWYARKSALFGLLNAKTWHKSFGFAGDLFLVGDVDGDGLADLVRGREFAGGFMQWSVCISTGNAFSSVCPVWAGAGFVGNIFRLADVTGDGRDDLIVGQVGTSATVVRWSVRPSTGGSFSAKELLHEDAGEQGNLFLLGDVTGNGRDDLVVIDRLARTAATYESDGLEFHFVTEELLAAASLGDPPYDDYVMLGDVNGDGLADIVTAYVDPSSDTAVTWSVNLSQACAGFLPDCFLHSLFCRSEDGNAGDLVRLSDVLAQGQVELVRGRHSGMDSLTLTPDFTRIAWSARLKTPPGNCRFGGPVFPLAVDAGNEGDLFP